MQFSDVQKEFQRIRATLEAGNTKLSALDYEGAVNDFEECLEILEKGHPQDHPDRISCLTGLGNAYFALHKFDQARQIFAEVHEIYESADSARIDNSVAGLATQFKLAKSTERAGLTDEALSMYQSLTEVAEQSLGQGHPFFSTILESHANLLSRTGAKKQANIANEKARSNRSKYSSKESFSTNVLAGLSQSQQDAEAQLTDDYMSIFSAPASKNSTNNLRKKSSLRANISGAVSGGKAQFTKTAPTIGLVLISLMVGGFLLFLNPQLLQKDEDLHDKNYQSQKFVSLDNLVTLELISSSKAVYSASGLTKTISWARGGSNLASLHKKDGLIFRESNGKLTDLHGLTLYAEDTLELKVVDNMRDLAAAGRDLKPDRDKADWQVTELSFLKEKANLQNPVNAEAEPVKVMFVPDWNGESVFLRDLGQTKPVLYGDNLSPGCVYGYYLHGKNSINLFVRGCDRSGHLLKSSKPESFLVFSNASSKKAEPISASAINGFNLFKTDPFLIIN